MDDTGEAIDDYLIWELCKQKGIHRMIEKDSEDGERILEEVIDPVTKEYESENYSPEEKIDLIREISGNPSHKIEKFRNLSWEKGEASSLKLGTTLPRVGDLPPEIITGKLPEVVKFVENTDPQEYRSVEYIRNLVEVPEILNEFSALVISPGEIIRQPERMRRVHGKEGWEIAEVWGAVHDANHRTIARLIAEDHESVDCFVGRRPED